MARMENAPLLEVKDLHLSFGRVKALDGLSFNLNEGELLGIVGPNGSGKTSLLNCINGFYRPQRGKIIFEGIDITGKHPHEIAKLGISRCFQGIGLSPHLNVVENIMCGAHIMATGGSLGARIIKGLQYCFFCGGAKSEELRLREKAEEIIDFLELYRYRNFPAGMLPPGIQKIVGLARAIASGAKLLLLDEPSAGLGYEEKRDVARAIVELNKLRGITIILVEHDMTLVKDLSHRIMVLAEGKKIAEDIPDRIITHPKVREVYTGIGG